MVTATQRRRAVDHLKSRRISERRACRLVGLSRSAAWYCRKGGNDGALRERLKQLASGRRLRVLNVVDDFSRECVLQIVDFSISGDRLARELDGLSRPLPGTIVCDNGLLASDFFDGWAKGRLHDAGAHKSLIHGQATVLPA